MTIAPDCPPARHRHLRRAVLQRTDRAKQVIDLGAIGHRQCTRTRLADEQIAGIRPDGIQAIHRDRRGDSRSRNSAFTGTQLVQNLQLAAGYVDFA
ncbi:hypothetical protein D3C72_2316990 [compost metagenome]